MEYLAAVVVQKLVVGCDKQGYLAQLFDGQRLAERPAVCFDRADMVVYHPDPEAAKNDLIASLDEGVLAFHAATPEQLASWTARANSMEPFVGEKESVAGS